MKYLRRLMWYLASRLLVITVVLGLMTVVFYYAMNLTNIYVVLKDGMAMRAKVIMMHEDESELTKYFQQSWLEKDNALLAARQGSSPYENYNVRGIDHRLEMGFMWVWPWDSNTTVTITESIPRIDGRAKAAVAEKLVAQNGAGALYPPAWTGGTYRVNLVQENGQWHVRSLILQEK